MTPYAFFRRRHRPVRTSVVSSTRARPEPHDVTCPTAMAVTVPTAPLVLHSEQVVSSVTTRDAVGTSPSVQPGPVLTTPATAVTLPTLLHSSQEPGCCRLCTCMGHSASRGLFCPRKGRNFLKGKLSAGISQ